MLGTYPRRVYRQLNTAQLPAHIFTLGELLKEKQGQGVGRKGKWGSIFTVSTSGLNEASKGTRKGREGEKGEKGSMQLQWRAGLGHPLCSAQGQDVRSQMEESPSQGPSLPPN